ncbi:MAG: carbohydrate kinase [Nitrospinae bacterium]|nr:carbohydrate kinase [Nitrospinota bacterium]
MNRNRLKGILKRFSKQKVMVIGDMVADEYILGMTSRVSREAPVLVLKYDSQTVLPGCAANAVNNIHSLGGTVFPVGAVGNDEMGKKLICFLKEKGVDTEGIISDETRLTPTKTRILAGGYNTTKQQVIRIDRENNNSIGKKTEERLLKIFMQAAERSDAILVSDYGLGTISQNILNYINKLAKMREKVITVESRFDILKYHHITAATPNSEEVEWALNVTLDGDNIRQYGKKILKRIRSDGLLITRGKEGMTLFESDEDITDIAIYGTDQVADVTGAGDTVISAFTLALASKASMKDAARLANYAGGIVVMKSGTATVTTEEIENAIDNE